MRRVVYFVLTNLAVLFVMGLLLRLFGLDQALAGRGINMTTLAIFALVWGMGGATISLLISKWMALNMTGAQVIDRPENPTEAWLLRTVAAQAEAAGIGRPDVAVYDSPEPNAFATGARRDSALVAVSTGLLANMSREEVEGVLGHEVSHVANGDMVTMTLIQGVLNAFVIFLARLVGALVDGFLRGDREERSYGHGPGYWLVSILAELAFGILASMVVMAFSRSREYRADAGGARLAGKGAMIAALQRLRSLQGHPEVERGELPQSLAAFGIRGGRGFARLFMSHPPLEERIAALQKAG